MQIVVYIMEYIIQYCRISVAAELFVQFAQQLHMQSGKHRGILAVLDFRFDLLHNIFYSVRIGQQYINSATGKKLPHQ